MQQQINDDKEQKAKMQQQINDVNEQKAEIYSWKAHKRSLK